MTDGSFDWEWGDWVLGDLSDVLSRACDAVGRVTAVERVTVAPPTAPDALPLVTLGILEGRDLFRLRTELSQCEHLVSFVGTPTDESWVADLVGVRLEVVLEGGGRQ